MGIAEVSFFAGTLLFFVAIIGGGIEIKELKIPQITGSAKYSCLAGGLLFIVLGLYLKNVFAPLTVPNQPATVKVETPAIGTTPTVLPIQPTETTTATQPPVTATQTEPANTNTQTPSSETANTAEKSLLAKQYAETQLETVTKHLNEVWNAADKDIRNDLLPKQQAWLKQRDTDCATKAANEPNTDEVMKEALKIGCMAKLTEPRIAQLQQDIKELEQSIVEEPQTPSIASVNSISLQETNAKQQLDNANKRLNAVWNATSADIRKALLPEQREWLKKREEDCTAQAVNEDKAMQEVLKLTCMANMTDPRTEELKQKIADLTQ